MPIASYIGCLSFLYLISDSVRFHAVLDQAIELSDVVINSTDLLLGQKLNVFLCTVEFRNTETINPDASLTWSISDGTENITYADLLGCDPLQDSYVRTQ